MGSRITKVCVKIPLQGPSFSIVKGKEDGLTHVDEPAQYSRMLYRSPCEAYSRIMSYKYAILSHIVIPLKIHLPGKQNVYLTLDTAKKTLENIQAGILSVTPLTAYWKQWKDLRDKNGRFLLFEQVPELFRFYCHDKKSEKMWHKRRISKDPKRVAKRKPIIGRILPVSPRDPEKFALYLLMRHFPGDEEELKSVSGKHCDTFADAARLHGLLDDNKIWEKTLTYGANSLRPSEMRQLFVNILVFGATEKCVVDALHLWNMFSRHMYDGRCGDAEKAVRIDRALAIIERLLIAQGRMMTEFGLPFYRSLNFHRSSNLSEVSAEGAKKSIGL